MAVISINISIRREWFGALKLWFVTTVDASVRGSGELYTGILWYLCQLICCTFSVSADAQKMLRWTYMQKALLVGSIASGISKFQSYLVADGKKQGREQARKAKGKLPSGHLARGANWIAFPWICNWVKKAAKRFCPASSLVLYSFH